MDTKQNLVCPYWLLGTERAFLWRQLRSSDFRNLYGHTPVSWAMPDTVRNFKWPPTDTAWDPKSRSEEPRFRTLNQNYELFLFLNFLIYALSCSNWFLAVKPYGNILLCSILLCCLCEAKSVPALFWIISHPGWALQIFAGFGLLSFSQRLLQLGRSTEGTLLNSNALKERKLIGRKSESAFTLTQSFSLCSPGFLLFKAICYKTHILTLYAHHAVT